jgi:hypothetical protein
VQAKLCERIRATFGAAECIEVEGDGEAEKESAEAVVDGLVLVGEGALQERHGNAGEETNVADCEEATGLEAETISGEAHGGFSELKFSL